MLLPFYTTASLPNGTLAFLAFPQQRPSREVDRGADTLLLLVVLRRHRVLVAPARAAARCRPVAVRVGDNHCTILRALCLLF